MTKKQTPQPTNPAARPELPSRARWAQAGLALCVSFVLVNWAIDTGSLLEYALAIIFFGLSVRHIRQALKQRKKEKGEHDRK